MKQRKVSQWIRCAAFLLIAACLFSFLTSVLERKTYTGAWNYMAKLNEFYSLEEDSLSYVVLGSSHAYCTVNPLTLWNETGIKGFVLATQQQPLRATYHYLVEAFKTQSPEVVFVEGYMGASADSTDAVLYDAVDPLGFSLNKLQMISALVDAPKQADYVFNIAKYHTRWSQLSADELLRALDEPVDIYKGFVPLENSYQGYNFIPDDSLIGEAYLPEENLAALNDILELCNAHSARLVLLIAPYDPSADSVARAIKAETQWAKEKNVDVWDYSRNLNDLGLDPAEDYYDKEHLDCSGADKISVDMGRRLVSLGIQGDPVDDEWTAHFNTYRKTFRQEG